MGLISSVGQVRPVRAELPPTMSETGRQGPLRASLYCEVGEDTFRRKPVAQPNRYNGSQPLFSNTGAQAAWALESKRGRRPIAA
jgi:hypothetical protein